jgi:hypothetical protein
MAGCVQEGAALPATTVPAAGPAASTTAHQIYFLTNATMSADGGRSRDVTGTSGLTSPKGYRLEGDAAKIAAHANQQVRVSGTVQNPEIPGEPAGSAPVLRVQSITMLAQKCK